MKARTLAGIEAVVRPAIVRFGSPQAVTDFYSRNRVSFISRLDRERIYGLDGIPKCIPQASLERTLWGIKFRSGLMNAAGMFKNGECYDLMALQGAGAYLGGTGTYNARDGYRGDGIYLPFVPYPRSHAASNKLALPNDGDERNSRRANLYVSMKRPDFDGFPLGWSVMGSPDFNGQEKLEKLVLSMKLYGKAGVDFLEINESCPNTECGRPQDEGLANRLKYIKDNFLDRGTRRLPVDVKFSTDTKLEQVPYILDLLFELGFDGVNFGNTSTAYSVRRQLIDRKEQRLYNYFINTFGGGVSGRPLKESSLELAARAVEYTKKGPPKQEFHVIRTGGIETAKDIEDSERAGISLNQWFTGYWEGFARHGHDVYRNLYNGLGN